MSLDVQVARHDEQIKAMRDELRSGFDRIVDAFEKHVAEDEKQHARIEKLEKAWVRVIGMAIGASTVVQVAFAYWSHG